MNGNLKYEVPTATQNIGDRYIEDYEMMQTPELSSYADGEEYQSADFIDNVDTIRYSDLGGTDNLIALEEDNFYGANGKKTTKRKRIGSAIGGFFGGVGEEIKKNREARRQRRQARVEGKQARKMTEAQAQLETARSLGKGSEADLEVAKQLAGQPPVDAKKGLSTGAIIGISVGALVVIGIVTYLIIKKRGATAVASPVLKPAI